MLEIKHKRDKLRLLSSILEEQADKGVMCDVNRLNADFTACSTHYDLS